MNKKFLILLNILNITTITATDLNQSKDSKNLVQLNNKDIEQLPPKSKKFKLDSIYTNVSGTFSNYKQAFEKK